MSWDEYDIEIDIFTEDMDEFLKPSKGWIRNHSGNEYIYDFHLKKLPIIIKVASSIRVDTGRARNKGADAIRVFAVVKEGLDVKDKVSGGLLKSKRVYRTDNWRENLEKLVLDTIKRAKKVYIKHRT
jgi:hypothetical protein